ncbi:biosynthetic peptidoglycan transglycosylase [Rhodoferax sp.]|uniref:biosynthetic peptidoglycan transglycosylase n=1 Tax=Rhodoferax sp. TaxID=50421 RepID=UPI00284DC99E|nr:biosynthetic peptidoglycan transglycosylase [Rhodoferax sp.]MDR3371085.1 transglycosylase domain-containing protein [Rhodoferax sp.]
MNTTSDPSSHHWLRALHRFCFWLGLISVGLALVMLVMLGVLRSALRPPPGAWSTRVHVGPVAIEVGVPSLIWLGTTPWLAQQLDGHTLPTRIGPVRMAWDAHSHTMRLTCQPCSLRSSSWGSEPLRLTSVSATVQRLGAMQLHGTLSAGAVHATWHGQLQPNGLQLDMTLAPTPVRDGYALFASAIPELAVAQIDGTFALHASLSLPSKTLTLTPQLQGMSVQGLGTAQWANARSQCGNDLSPAALAAPLNAQSLLARAVIAAEDQRFFEHPGYDLAEMSQALHSNQRTALAQAETSTTDETLTASGTALRGASTLSQQVAKLLVTGGDRSPVRKLRELLYAVEMEQTLGKARILRLYLDNAPWGSNLCGAQAAAQHYFNKRADHLTAPEAVWLAAMLHNPALEAKRWASSGHINVARARWVAGNLRGMGKRQRVRLMKGLGSLQ